MILINMAKILTQKEEQKRFSIYQPELPFPDWNQTGSARDGHGTRYDILVPTELQITEGMPMPQKVKVQDPLLPYNGIVPNGLTGFNVARSLYNKGIAIVDGIHFYLYDNIFSCLLNSPVTYTAMLMNVACTISTDFSVYMNWTEHDKRQSVWRNQTLERLWRYNGISVITNVSWAGPDSYTYCFQFIPKHDIIAINSMGIKGDPDAVYFWHKGYDYVISHLEPKLILRYGDKMDGENETISRYFTNPVIERLHNGR